MVKVPPSLHFIEDFPVDKFNLDFGEIFSIFNLLRLEASLIRLWVLHQARQARLQKVSDVAVADPYHKHEHNLHSTTRRNIMRNYIVDLMVVTKADYFLIPYHPV